MDIKEKFQQILANSTFAGSGNHTPFKKQEIEQKRKRLKNIQKNLASKRPPRNISYIHGILDEIVAGMEVVSE